jgi:hypothetical protein
MSRSYSLQFITENWDSRISEPYLEWVIRWLLTKFWVPHNISEVHGAPVFGVIMLQVE